MTDENKKRPIRSFVRRQGRMTPGQKKAYDELFQKYGLILDEKKLDYKAIFKRQAPVIVEIGFGMGEALLQLAKNHPNENFIGIDVHKPGVGAVLMGIKKDDLHNVKVFCDDAIEILNQKIADESLDGVHLFFPDPWPKKRHHKRRLVSQGFAILIRQKLKLGGYIHMATDWENYAESMLDVMSNADGFINSQGHGQFAKRPESRPLARCEQRGEKLGHQVWDLIFIRES